MALRNNIGVDFQKKLTFSKLFTICDEFVSPLFVMHGSSFEKVLLKKGFDTPRISTCYYSDSPTLSHSFAVQYNDFSIIMDLKRRLEKNPFDVAAQEAVKAFDRPASGIVITVDGRETISLNQNVRSKSSNNGFASFPIGQDDFLKLCNANHLKFEVFKGGEAFTEFFDNEKDDILMIEHCRALYNYVVDDSMFPDALPKLLRWKKTGRIGKSTVVQRFEDVELVEPRKTKICVLIAIVLILLLILAL